MSSDLNTAIDNALIFSETSTTAIWKLLLEIYKVEVNNSILSCDIVYGSFQKQLKNAKKDLTKGYTILAEIFLELKNMEQISQINDFDTTVLTDNLTDFQELFVSPRDRKLQESLEFRADQCSDMIEHKLEVLSKRKREVDRAASLTLTTAGLSFAGFAAVLGASAKAMICKNAKATKFFLRVSSGGLLLASAVQLAEYLDYDQSIEGVLYDLKTLRESLTDLLEDVDKFNVELRDVVEQITYFSRDGKSLINCSSDNESFSSKVSKVATKAKALQITLVRLEAYIEDDVKIVEADRDHLPKKHRVQKRPVKKVLE